MSDSIKKWHEMQEEKEDLVVNSVIEKFKSRSRIGVKKYGTTLHDNPDGFYKWIQHAQEEAMDFVLYLEKIKRLNDA